MGLNPKVNQMQMCILRLISLSFIKICPAVRDILPKRQTNKYARTLMSKIIVPALGEPELDDWLSIKPTLLPGTF